jgi:hypothetical protein
MPRARERRAVARTPARFKIKIAVTLANKPAPLVGPALVHDVSTESLRCHTKHRLSPGQSVRLSIPTSTHPPQMGLPKKFLGSALVVWSNALDSGVYDVALRFDEDLRDDIQLAVFVEHLQSVARTANA